MRTRILRFILPLLASVATPAFAEPLLLISVDGLRPGDVVEARKRGIKVPNLERLMSEGIYASGVRGVAPTLTFPSHTTLITGVAPAKHGIPGNTVFDPLHKNLDGWYWYSPDIKVPTLWDAAHSAGKKVGNVEWPVSVGTSAIDYNIAEYWRAKNTEDLKLIRALSTPRLVAELEKLSGTPFFKVAGEESTDDGRTTFAEAIIEAKRPDFVTVHLPALDHDQHAYGPGSAEAIATLEKTDAAIGELIEVSRKARPDTVVAIVSDHGFAKVDHDINLIRPFVEAGLITLDQKGGQITDWQASLWGGPAVAVVLREPNDAEVRAKVAAVLAKLAADPANGIERILDAQAGEQIGATPLASFWVDFKPGYQMSQRVDTPAVGPSSVRGTHGYLPSHPEMRATFILSGPNVPKRGNIGDIDMRAIAPTLAKLMNVDFPSADLKPLF